MAFNSLENLYKPYFMKSEAMISFCNEHLLKGSKAKVAEELGVSLQLVCLVLRGMAQSKRVLLACFKQAIADRLAADMEAKVKADMEAKWGMMLKAQNLKFAGYAA